MIKAAEIDLTQFMESCVSYSHFTYCMYISKSYTKTKATTD